MRAQLKAGLRTFVALLALAACEDVAAPPGRGGEFYAGPAQFAWADPPGIEGDLDTDLIVDGAKVVADGVGLHDATAGQINVTVPGGATIQSVILYWGARAERDDLLPPDLSMISVTVGATTSDVDGEFIGTEDIDPGNDSHSWRADLLNHVAGFSFGTGLNTVDLTVPDDGIAGAGIDGASLVITYDDGTSGSVELRDGNDFAYLPRSLETNEQTFTFPSSPADRTATLLLVVGDVEDSRPTQIVITSDGTGDQLIDNGLGDGAPGRDGAEWDTRFIDVLVPAGSTELSVQLFSWDDPANNLEPASLYWVLGALELEDPPPPPVCDGLTPGYWRNWSNHYEEEEFEELVDWVNDYTDGVFPDVTIPQITAILSYGGSDAVLRLKKFYYANLLTLALTDHPGLPNPDAAGLGEDCTHPDFDETLGEALDAAEEIFENGGSRGYINAVKDILDKIANLNN